MCPEAHCKMMALSKRSVSILPRRWRINFPACARLRRKNMKNIGMISARLSSLAAWKMINSVRRWQIISFLRIWTVTIWRCRSVWKSIRRIRTRRPRIQAMRMERPVRQMNTARRWKPRSWMKMTDRQ